MVRHGRAAGAARRLHARRSRAPAPTIDALAATDTPADLDARAAPRRRRAARAARSPTLVLIGDGAWRRERRCIDARRARKQDLSAVDLPASTCATCPSAVGRQRRHHRLRRAPLPAPTRPPTRCSSRCRASAPAAVDGEAAARAGRRGRRRREARRSAPASACSASTPTWPATARASRRACADDADDAARSARRRRLRAAAAAQEAEGAAGTARQPVPRGRAAARREPRRRPDAPASCDAAGDGKYDAVVLDGFTPADAAAHARALLRSARRGEPVRHARRASPRRCVTETAASTR